MGHEDLDKHCPTCRCNEEPHTDAVAWAREHINANAAEWHTGGGCTAIGIPTDDGGHWLITDDASAPTALDKPVCVGRYDKEGEHWFCFGSDNMQGAAKLIASFVSWS